MDFFLEIHIGECGFGGHFLISNHCPIVLIQLVSHTETVSTQAEYGIPNPEPRTQKSGRGNEQGECTLLII